MALARDLCRPAGACVIFVAPPTLAVRGFTASLQSGLDS
jgi:hypothetical protein